MPSALRFGISSFYRKGLILSIFYHRFQAFCAHNLFHRFPIFHNGRFLQIRSEFAFRSPLGKTAIVPKSGCFSTNFTSSHFHSLSIIRQSFKNKVK